ncbi:MAG: sodium:solute symporter family protein [Desulfobacterales bacterium]|nr:sodium:solute symporter family protein [Desulfobacterales bacterium]
MSNDVITILTIMVVYLLIILGLGLYSFRFSRPTMEDYHMAGREFNTFILFCAVFGTNISAVALIGGPGKAYHLGWGVWAYFVTAWGWLTPVLFYVIGNRAWKVSNRFFLITQSDLFLKRFSHKGLSRLTSCVLIFYTVPYIMAGVIGGGRTFSGLTQGAVPYWLGALLVTLIVCLYVTVGGMRGTAWTNTVQTVVFLIGSFLMFALIAYGMGGPAKATELVVERFPYLMDRSRFPMSLFFSYGIIVSLSVPMFPQVYIRLLTGNKPAKLRRMTMIYPFAAILIWVLMAYIGMWGHISFPELQGAESDKILPMLLAKYAPVWITGVLGAAIFAALMSSLDAQLLTLGTLLTRDFLGPGIKRKEKEGRAVLLSRMFIIGFALVAFIGALIKPMGIIRIIEWGFAGYASIIIPVIATLYWKRCTAAGCIGSIAISQIILLGIPLGFIPKAISFGMLPGIPALAAGLFVLFVVSLITEKPAEKEILEFFDSFNSTQNVVKETVKI